jgi:ubiquinone biosynthesis protein UbiJ
MILEKINKLISDILEVSNINEEDFRYLNGKNINIVLKNTSTVLYININDERIVLNEVSSSEPDLILEGSPIAFINFANDSSKDENIKIYGQASLAESFSKIISKANINWEQLVSEYTNDEIAFYSKKIFVFLNEKKNDIKNSFIRNTKEYIRDETDILPSKESIQEHIKNVDDLRNRVDFLDAKIKKIK